MIAIFVFNGDKIFEKQDYIQSATIFHFILLPLYAIVGYAHFSVLVTMRLLCRKGTSNDLKMKVLLRHFTYLVIFDLYLTFGLLIALKVVEVSQYGYILNSLGILLGVIRFVEPYVF